MACATGPVSVWLVIGAGRGENARRSLPGVGYPAGVATTTAWGRWDCTRCEQKDISGRDKRCPACGDPREQHELDAMRPPDESEFTGAALTDPAELALASAGADWSCGYCGSNNPNDASHCGSCGGARKEAASMGKVGAPGAEVAAPFPEPRAQPRSSSARPPPPPEPRPRPRFERWQIAAAAAAVLGVLLYWGCRDREEEGVVTRLQWTHTSQLQRWVDKQAGDWGPVAERAEVPPVGGRGEVAGVDVRGCHQKHHHDESYSCGTESYQGQESYTCGSTQECSTSNNGNGSFSRSCRSVSKTCTRSVTKTRTKYCSRPIYREWCDYTTQIWSNVRSADVSGEGHDLRYAEIPTDGDRERVEHSGSYWISFAWDGGDELHKEPVERAVYDRWQVGEAAILQVEHFRGVVGFRKKAEAKTR